MRRNYVEANGVTRSSQLGGRETSFASFQTVEATLTANLNA